MGELMARQSHQLLPGAPERGNPARRATGTNMQAAGLNRWSGKAAPVSEHVCLSQKPSMLPVPLSPRRAPGPVLSVHLPWSFKRPPSSSRSFSQEYRANQGCRLLFSCGSGAPPFETGCRRLQLFKHCPVLLQGYLCVAVGVYE